MFSSILHPSSLLPQITPSILQSLPITRQLHAIPRHPIHTRTQILNPQILLLINPLSSPHINTHLLLPLFQSTRLDILTPRQRLLLLTALDEMVYDLSDQRLARFVNDCWAGSGISSSTRSASTTGGATSCSVTSAHFGGLVCLVVAWV